VETDINFFEKNPAQIDIYFYQLGQAYFFN